MQELKTDLPHVVNFSGGRTSAYLVSLFEEAKKKQPDLKVEYVFCDTGAEHPKTYEFIKKVVEHFKIDLTCIRTKVIKEKGRGSSYKIVNLSDCKQDLKPFHDVAEKYGVPNFKFMHCTRELKVNPAKKYCKDIYGNGNYLNWLGIRIDEPKRLSIIDDQVDMFSEAKKIDKSKANVRYLASISDFEKTDVLSFWRKMPFDLDLDEHLGNCVFCVKKGVNKVALAARDEPEMANKFIEMIASDRITARKEAEFAKDVMYRNHMSLTGVIKLFDDITTDQLILTVEGRGELNADTCSESCDAIFDLFEEVDANQNNKVRGKYENWTI
jgi:3'-phosphoadenosine 5'-phosphosulfate sulfotransferase (PAPS reductase)/FAD synthetase